MAHNYNPRMRMPVLTEALRRRKAQLANFPIGSFVEWKHSPGRMQVTEHDRKNGRVVTDTGGSYIPDELTRL